MLTGSSAVNVAVAQLDCVQHAVGRVVSLQPPRTKAQLQRDRPHIMIK